GAGRGRWTRQRGCRPRPAEGPGRVDRPAAGPWPGAAVTVDDEVDQRLAGDGDHLRAHPGSLMPPAPGLAGEPDARLRVEREDVIRLDVEGDRLPLGRWLPSLGARHHRVAAPGQ